MTERDLQQMLRDVTYKTSKFYMKMQIEANQAAPTIKNQLDLDKQIATINNAIGDAYAFGIDPDIIGFIWETAYRAEQRRQWMVLKWRTFALLSMVWFLYYVTSPFSHFISSLGVQNLDGLIMTAINFALYGVLTVYTEMRLEYKEPMYAK